jgi:hypothetical protein
MMSSKKKIKEEIKVWIYYQILKSCDEVGQQVTFGDVNSALIDILAENNDHDPKELFKKQ